MKRTLGCTCRTSKATCPVELYKNFARAFEKAFPGRDRAKAWLTSSPEGEKIIKVKLVNAWAKAAGRPVRGHSPRRSGTMFYVRAGPQHRAGDLPGRWHSDLVFQYGEEAWEADRGGCLHPAPAKHEAEATKTLEGPTSTRLTPLIGNLPADPPRWVRVSGSKVVHQLCKQLDSSSSTWKTRCGWAFARTHHFTLLIEPPTGVPRCLNCRLNWDPRGKPTGTKAAESSATKAAERAAGTGSTGTVDAPGKVDAIAF